MAQPNIRIDIASVFKDKGFKQADKASGVLDEKFKKLARTFVTVFSTAAIIKFGKESVKAFEEDEKAAVRLGQALKGLNLAFATPEIENYLSALEKSTFVSDDELRPAFQRLAQTTRSVAMSQDLLATAIDVSAGSGVDLQTVANDLSRAFVGQTRGLTKYNLGLTQAELKTIRFEQIQSKLNEQFGGQRSALLDTYGGKVIQISTAYERMQETVGSGLVDAFGMLAGENGIQGATKSMEEFGVIGADVIRGIGFYVGKVTSQIGGSGGLMQAITGTAMTGNPLAAAIVALQKAGQKTRPLMFPTLGIGQPGVDAKLKAIEEEAIKRQKELEKLRLKSIKQQEKLNRLKQISAKIDQAAAKFDEKRIQIQAALQGNLSAEERKRLNELLLIEETKEAIADQDVEKAEKLLKELERLQSETTILAENLIDLEAGNPFAQWDQYTTYALGLVGQMRAALDDVYRRANDFLRIEKGVGAGTITQPNPNPNAPDNNTAANAAAAAADAAARAAADAAAKKAADAIAAAAAAAKAAQDAADAQKKAYEDAEAQAKADADLIAAAAAAAKAAADAIAEAERAAAEAAAAQAAAKTAAEKEAADAQAAAAKGAFDAAKVEEEAAKDLADAAADELGAAAASAAEKIAADAINAIIESSGVMGRVAGESGAIGAAGITNVIVNVAGSVISQEDLTQVITDTQANYQRSGGGITIYSEKVI